MKIASWIPFLLLLLFPSYPLGALDISPKELPWRASELTDPRRELDGLAAKAEEAKNAELAIAVALAAIATGENPYRVIPRCRFAAPLKVAQLRQIYDFLQTEENLRTADDVRKELGTVQDLPLAWQRFIRAREEGGEDESIFATGLRAAAELDTGEVIFQELRLLHDPSAATAEAEIYFQNHEKYPPRVRAMLEELVEAERLTAAVALVNQLPLGKTEEVGLQFLIQSQILLPDILFKQACLSKKGYFLNCLSSMTDKTPWYSTTGWSQALPARDYCRTDSIPVRCSSQEVALDAICNAYFVSQFLTPSDFHLQQAKTLVSSADNLNNHEHEDKCFFYLKRFPRPYPLIASAYLSQGDLEGARRMALVHLGDSDVAPIIFHPYFAYPDFACILPGLRALGPPDSPMVPELARRYRLGLERLKANDGFSARRHFRRALRKDKDLATLRHLLLEAEQGQGTRSEERGKGRTGSPDTRH